MKSLTSALVSVGKKRLRPFPKALRNIACNVPVVSNQNNPTQQQMTQ